MPKILRIFGSDSCQNCDNIINFLEKKKSISYIFVDAFAENEDIQNLCDKYGVDELPHIQTLDDDGKVINELIGYVPKKYFLKFLRINFDNI